MVEIDRWFPSSKICSNCFYQVDEMPLEVRQWTCPLVVALTTLEMETQR
ncbi:hypothetical protein [Microseira sp. BLCC-F43]